jgi:hypothetical protein
VLARAARGGCLCGLVGSIVLRATFSPAAALLQLLVSRSALRVKRGTDLHPADLCPGGGPVPSTVYWKMLLCAGHFTIISLHLQFIAQEYGITGRNCYNSWRNSRVAVGCSLGARRPGWKEQPSQHRAVRPLQRLSRDLPRRSPRRAADGRLALSGSCGPAGELAHLVRSHEVSKNEPPAS